MWKSLVLTNNEITMDNISMIVCMALNNAIGHNNDLVYHFKEDMKRFVEITTGHTVVMGRKTYESLPGKKPLKDRDNIIISRTLATPNGFDICRRPENILELAKKNPDKQYIIIGGAEIYKIFLPHTNNLYLTVVNEYPVADTFFPELDLLEWNFKLDKDRKFTSKKGTTFEFFDLTRIKPNGTASENRS